MTKFSKLLDVPIDNLILPEEAVFLGDLTKPFEEYSASFIFDEIFSNPTSLFAKGYSLNVGDRLKYLLISHKRVRFKIDALKFSTVQEKLIEDFVEVRKTL